MVSYPFELVAETVARLCVTACTDLPPDVTAALQAALARETAPLPEFCLRSCLENARLAREERLPLCQDTGLCVVFCELGEDAAVEGGLRNAVNEGVRRGYTRGLLRASVVSCPLGRVNTGDNTPADIHIELTQGAGLRLTVLPKGFGSENCSRLFMLPPSAGRQGVLSAVLAAVSDAGAGACPPLVVGVGVGGTADSCLLAAKRALLRPVGEPNPDPLYGSLEEEILAAVNAADIGPQGLGGLTTALAVHITPLPTHIAALPVGVNMSCHSLRRAGCQLTIGDGGCARPAPPR